ncbi:MAG: hydantoinase/oxoprolinase family protein, partial [Deltaproteobacteria bacterium]|nr:hydantoinase/oxoprolinase family protein [Deltaproteobacteria bacterium]
MHVEAFAAKVSTIVHGTTVTTNAVLTRNGALTGLVTTAGVRDALEMRRGIREEQYNNHYENVRPLVERHLRIGVAGRLDGTGKELVPLNLEEVKSAAASLREAGVEAVAICFMNAFAEPRHEQAAAEVIREELPDAYLSISSEVLPTIRFFNRVSTTALNAYSGPVFRSYIRSLTKRLESIGYRGALLIMQSSGGVATPDVTEARPATTLLSGPAAGPKAALTFTRPLGHESCVVVDMGGTSFDASLVKDGQVALQSEGEINRLRIALPMLDITTIGAGGGSIGFVDSGGLLRMGPESAGAAPGPACYGRGGDRPACTDADLVLGYLDPQWFAGGEIKLDVDLARRAIADHVAGPLDVSVEEAASGMYRVINANMAHGVREVTVKRGVDPREFPMVVAGGAGGLHACMIAEDLGMTTILVPEVASILCASGMLLTDLQHDEVRSLVGPLADLANERLRQAVAGLIEVGGEHLVREGVPPERGEHQVYLDLRYLKQYHEVTIPVSVTDIEEGNVAGITAAFHEHHGRLYGYELSAQGTELELINVRVRTTGKVDKPELPRFDEGNGDAGHASKGERSAFLPSSGRFASVPVYDGHALLAGDRIDGPALIERRDTTFFVTSSFRGRLDPHGTMVLTSKGGPS